MDRRTLIKRLGALGLLAVIPPELLRPERTYFFGPWAASSEMTVLWTAPSREYAEDIAAFERRRESDKDWGLELRQPIAIPMKGNYLLFQPHRPNMLVDHVAAGTTLIYPNRSESKRYASGSYNL